MSLERLLAFYGLLATRFSSLQVVFRITSLGCCAAGSFPEISVWRSLVDWYISLISKKHFSFCAQYSVSIYYYYYNYSFLLGTKVYVCSFALFSEGEKAKWLLFMKVRWSFQQMPHDLCSLGMWIILAKIFVNISHHFSRARRVKAT